MRLLILTALLALLASLVLANDTIDCRSSNRNGEQNREIVQAINAFCGWTWDLVRLPFSVSPSTHTSPFPLLPAHSSSHPIPRLSSSHPPIHSSTFPDPFPLADDSQRNRLSPASKPSSAPTAKTAASESTSMAAPAPRHRGCRASTAFRSSIASARSPSRLGGEAMGCWASGRAGVRSSPFRVRECT